MQTFYFSNLLIDETVLRSEKKRIPFRSHRLAGNTTRGFVHIKASTSKKGKNEKENKETLIFCNEKKVVAHKFYSSRVSASGEGFVLSLCSSCSSYCTRGFGVDGGGGEERLSRSIPPPSQESNTHNTQL